MGRRFTPYTVELDISGTAADGFAVGRHDGRVIFVEYAVPGDKAEVEVFKRHKKQHFGRISRLLVPSPHRVEARCAHFGVCGGCKWQMMAYEAQLKFKQQQVLDAFERIGKLIPQKCLPIVGAEAPYYYRNKLEFTFSNKAWLTRDQIDSGQDFDQRVLGFHKPRIFDKIIDIDHCYLQTPLINDIRNEVKTFARQRQWPFYDIRNNQGLLRNLLFRTTLHQNQLMVVLILADNRPDVVDELFGHLESKFPQITHYLWIHNPKKNSSYSDLPFQLWKGKEVVVEKMGDYLFQISPTSFFQTNPRQAEKMYQLIYELAAACRPAGAAPFEVLYDLYAGTGSIGIFLSSLAKKVVGIEYVEAAVEDARKNVALNGLSHFTFYAGDIKKILSPELVSREGRPGLLIADPPRAGMDARVVAQILEIAPQNIIYVSCKPATQARDIVLLQQKYELLSIQPVDMFPQTAHVENIALLRRVDHQ
ncbi:MAG: 23S rRNA (uracil(1939)-C(5))-methyltransferase RlmD [Bacteroidetes bacterium]|nr:MAG: 23S rRNA (uracil(1939)-C(5))-methyltransferase RlmD [Bacteroidota bacterium]